MRSLAFAGWNRVWHQWCVATESTTLARPRCCSGDACILVLAAAGECPTRLGSIASVSRRTMPMPTVSRDCRPHLNYWISTWLNPKPLSMPEIVLRAFWSAAFKMPSCNARCV